MEGIFTGNLTCVAMVISFKCFMQIIHLNILDCNFIKTLSNDVHMKLIHWREYYLPTSWNKPIQKIWKVLLYWGIILRCLVGNYTSKNTGHVTYQDKNASIKTCDQENSSSMLMKPVPIASFVRSTSFRRGIRC